VRCQSRVRETILDLVKPVHKALRGRKVDHFLRIVGSSSVHEKLLDVGGGPGIDGEFLPLYARFEDVVVANPEACGLELSSGRRIKAIKADGRRLPFESQSFDWVFSNAVIEHVGGWEDQIRFANEVRRVSSRGYFVATPNKFFPMEPHTFVPFYQFLPTRIQKRILPYSLGYLRQYVRIHLLSVKQMQKLFPEARIVSIGFPMLRNSLAAVYSKVQRMDEGV
jgi:ubiquinone/menaquinone biosynthesis C-methylase UbiE